MNFTIGSRTRFISKMRQHLACYLMTIRRNPSSAKRKLNTKILLEIHNAAPKKSLQKSQFKTKIYTNSMKLA